MQLAWKALLCDSWSAGSRGGFSLFVHLIESSVLNFADKNISYLL